MKRGAGFSVFAMTNSAPAKITATATASNGKTYQRTMKRERFRFAVISLRSSGNGSADFFESEAEALAFAPVASGSFYYENGAYSTPEKVEVVSVKNA